MKPIDKDILKINQLYETILNDTKKRFVNEVMLVPISQQDYPNITTDSDTRFDQVNKSLLDDIQSVAESMGVTVKITTASSGHSSRTTSGNLSRHPSGEAVDISFFNNYGSRDAKSADEVDSNFRNLADRFVSKLSSMGYSRNSEGGSPKSVLWFFNDKKRGGNHFNHVHVSNTTSDSSYAKKEPTKDELLKTLAGNSSNKVANALSTGAQNVPSSNTDWERVSNPTHGLIYDFATEVGKEYFGLKEEKIYSSFGKNVDFIYGDVLIPENENKKIKSPVDGKINNSRYNPSGCKNSITIEHKINNKTFYLNYCGITDPKVVNGQKVSKGTLLGETTEDVNVQLFNSAWERKSIKDYLDIDSDNLDLSSKKKKDNSYSEKPTGIGVILTAPFRMFQDKYDEEGNVKEKRWLSPTETGLPNKDSFDIWSPTKTRKVKENIERIKNLLK